MRAGLRRLVFLGLWLGAVAHAADISVSPSSVPLGGSVTATWSGISSPTATDWIALATPGSADNSYVAWRYTTGAASGNVPFSIPSNIATGTYVLRLFANDGFTKLATSSSFSVTTVNVVLTVSGGGVLAGGEVTAGWSGIPSPTATDWIGLYTPAATHQAYISWRYTNGAASGSVPFTIPAGTAPGTYQLRLFAAGVYTHYDTSDNFAVHASVTGTISIASSPLAGVAIAPSPGGSCTPTNASGQYTCSVPAGWSGTLTPSLAGYAFTPASFNYNNVTYQSTNYSASQVREVSGTIAAGASPLSGVALAATNGGSCTSTNASGQYTCTVPLGWSGSVTPSLSPHAFSPASRAYSELTANQGAQDILLLRVDATGLFVIGGYVLILFGVYLLREGSRE